MPEYENSLTINDKHLAVGNQTKIINVGQEYRLFWVQMATLQRDIFGKSLLAKEELKAKFSIPEDGLYDMEGELVEIRHDADGLGWWAKISVKNDGKTEAAALPEKQ